MKPQYLRSKYIPDGINCRYALLVKRLVNLKIAIETIQDESQKKSGGKKMLSELWLFYSWTNIHAIGVIKGEGITKRICEEIMARIFLNLMKTAITIPRNSVRPKYKYYTDAHHNQIA